MPGVGRTDRHERAGLPAGQAAAGADIPDPQPSQLPGLLREAELRAAKECER